MLVADDILHAVDLGLSEAPGFWHSSSRNS